MGCDYMFGEERGEEGEQKRRELHCFLSFLFLFALRGFPGQPPTSRIFVGAAAQASGRQASKVRNVKHHHY
jgi:hypothetical protein